MQVNDEGLLSITEAAEVLGVSRTTLYDRILTPGVIKPKKIGTRRLIDPEDIRRYKASLTA